jgi:hypothetical protein
MSEVIDNSEGPVSKKAKVAQEWKITFDQTQGLRTLVEVVCNILTRVNFRVIFDSNRETHYLCIDSIDPQHVCMIQARLMCEKTENVDQKKEVDFCIDSNILNLILKSIPSHYSLDISKHCDSADLKLRAYETLSNSHNTEYIIPTLVDDSETMQLTDMNYNYTIEIDLGMLRQIVKMSMSLRAQQLEFSVNEPVTKISGLLRTMFTITSHGDATQSHNFHSSTVAENGDEDNYVIRAATDSTTTNPVDHTKTVYKDAFSAQYLNFFLKSMERQIITMKLSQDKPLIVHYPLGADKSYICFVLAPKQTDE